MNCMSQNSIVAGSLGLLFLGLSLSPARAVTPCFADPCADEQSAACGKISDWIAEGTLVEMRYRSEPVRYMVPVDPPVYQRVLAELVFVPDKVVKGTVAKGDVRLTLYTACWPTPELDDLRPMRIRIHARQSASGASLVHFVRLGK